MLVQSEKTVDQVCLSIAGDYITIYILYFNLNRLATDQTWELGESALGHQTTSLPRNARAWTSVHSLIFQYLLAGINPTLKSQIIVASMSYFLMVLPGSMLLFLLHVLG